MSHRARDGRRRVSLEPFPIAEASDLVGIAAPIAAIALAVCAVKMLWGGQKAAEEAKSTAIRIIIAIGVVMLAPSIVVTMKSWFKDVMPAWKF